MKKFFLMAAAALMIAACGSNGGGNSTDNVEPIKDGVTIENENFSITVPQGMKESWNSMGTINATADNGFVRFAISYMEGGPTKSQLKTVGENLKAMVHAMDQDAVIDEPKVEKNLVTLKSTSEGKQRIDFTYLKEDKVGVTGNFQFPEDKAAEWEDKFLPILKSVVYK